jgi:hypothetical protein
MPIYTDFPWVLEQEKGMSLRFVELCREARAPDPVTQIPNRGNRASWLRGMTRSWTYLCSRSPHGQRFTMWIFAPLVLGKNGLSAPGA